mmetsp:Transcript_10612/g.21368  ORF Transcript_10612/g.21368 Transcript_10612/m.21368 type:complete len:561 (-) Transcript_10612:126-1808(-)
MAIGFVNNVGRFGDEVGLVRRSGSVRNGRCCFLKGKVQMSARWPAGKFLRDALFFSPAGRWIQELPRVDPGEVMNRGQEEVGSAVVFVTGATGILGRRVVRTLQQRGVRVRALVRDLERARKVLGGTDGIDLDRMEFIVSDLYNLQPSFFTGVSAVVSVTGTRIGPVNDTPDRKRYSQGIVYYDPVVLEDTPENVEYVGIAKLAEEAKRHFAGVRDSQGMQFKEVLSFRNEEEVRRLWGTVDDVVMGGVSEGSLSVVDSDLGKVARFTGIIRTENRGGFSSVRTRPFDSPADLSSFDGFQFSVLGDGKRYKFICRCDSKWDGVSFSQSFDTVSGQWVDISIPFSELVPNKRARRTSAVSFEPSLVQSFQVMLSKFEYDGELNPHFEAGPFELQLSAISVYRKQDRGQKLPGPVFVHVSSAGVTRLLRTDEFPSPESLTPIVRLNQQLGRLMEWKFAGEDAIRSAMKDHSYVIIRPCALTEGEPVGLSKLAFDQGDNLTGKVSRDDCANLIVDLLFDPNAKRQLTLEVSDDSTKAQSLQSMSDDSEFSGGRTFCAFPFVPL